MKWPRVQRQHPSPDSRGGLPNTGVRPQTKVTDRGPRRNPEENCSAAQATVRRLEVALAALEESDVAAREAIQASLVKARAAARVIPLSDRITECRSFIERAERRVTKAEEAVQAAVSWKKQMEAEVEEGRARLRRLEEEEVQAVPVPTTSEVQRLQALVAQLQSQLVQVAPATLVRTFGQSVGSSCREAMSSGRLCPTLRRRDAGVDARATSRSASGCRSRTAPGSFEDLTPLDDSSSGVAGVDRPIHNNAVHHCERGEVSRSCCVSRDARYGWRVSESVRRHTPVHPNALQEMVERFKHVSGFADGATHWSHHTRNHSVIQDQCVV